MSPTRTVTQSESIAQHHIIFLFTCNSGLPVSWKDRELKASFISLNFLSQVVATSLVQTDIQFPELSNYINFDKNYCY